VNGIPAPATSHVACGFPALRAPAHFTTAESEQRYDTRYSEKSPSVAYRRPGPRPRETRRATRSNKKACSNIHECRRCSQRDRRSRRRMQTRSGAQRYQEVTEPEQRGLDARCRRVHHEMPDPVRMQRRVRHYEVTAPGMRQRIHVFQFQLRAQASRSSSAALRVCDCFHGDW
jgi:hypothetical protein